MAGTIKVDYSVMEQIIGDIYSQADEVESCGRLRNDIARSRGITASELADAARGVRSFACVLAAYMRETAKLLEEAKETMKAADASLATQFTQGSAEEAVAQAAKDAAGLVSDTYEKADVRLSDCVDGRSTE